MSQTQENDEKPHFGTDLGSGPNCAVNFFPQKSGFVNHHISRSAIIM